MKTLSIIIPVFNESENLPVLYKRLSEVLSNLKVSQAEVCFVDDHSTDTTPEVLKNIASRDSRVKWLRLSRNSGSHTACVAGIDQCDSDAAIIMAADLQDPPELIHELITRHLEGYQLVWAVRKGREGESWFTIGSSRLFYWLMNRLSQIKLPPQGADVFLADRCVLEAFRQMPERYLSLFAAFCWLGFRQTSVEYVKQTRHAGKSKWTIHRKILLAIDSLVGFSYLPLRFMSYAGFLFALSGALWALFIFTTRLLGVIQTPGFASIMIAILIIGGLQMVMMGVLGEYLWRTLEEARRRPRYFVESSSLGKK